MDGSTVQPPKHPIHTSHSCEIPQQHPLHVDTSLEPKHFFLILYILVGTVHLRGLLDNFFFIRFFWKIAHSKWNWIGKQLLLWTLFIFLFIIFEFFWKNINFIHSNKNNRNRWIFIVQVWFIYQTETRSIRKKRSALFYISKLNLNYFS